MEFYSEQEAANFKETEMAAVAAEKQADEQAEADFEKPEHL